MRPTLVNHDEEDAKDDYQKSYEQLIDGAETAEYVDYMMKNRNDIYNATGESLIPECLKFVKDIVESEDPSLNNSRENMQQNKLLCVDKMNLVKKSLEMLAETGEEKDEYKKYYEQSDENMKPGVHGNFDGLDITELEKFNTQKSEDEWIKMRENIDDRKEDQNDIMSLKKPHLIISRENMQQFEISCVIKKHLVKKSLDETPEIPTCSDKMSTTPVGKQASKHHEKARLNGNV